MLAPLIRSPGKNLYRTFGAISISFLSHFFSVFEQYFYIKPLGKGSSDELKDTSSNPKTKKIASDSMVNVFSVKELFDPYPVLKRPTPTLLAFTGLTNAHGPSTQPTA